MDICQATDHHVSNAIQKIRSYVKTCQSLYKTYLSLFIQNFPQPFRIQIPSSINSLKDKIQTQFSANYTELMIFNKIVDSVFETLESSLVRRKAGPIISAAQNLSIIELSGRQQFDRIEELETKITDNISIMEPPIVGEVLEVCAIKSINEILNIEGDQYIISQSSYESKRNILQQAFNSVRLYDFISPVVYGDPDSPIGIDTKVSKYRKKS